ncbi:MAG: hypothetical protein H6Q85_2202 [candidate division NC10 bacterium]|jgi:hypothetical protein|nr:hypothetical protein [candidate division NC10 bacterium]
MLGALAAVALAVGLIGTTVSVTHNHEQTAAKNPTPVVEVQAVQSANTPNK